MAAWKDLERRVAARFGGRRAGPTGVGGPDVIGVPFAIEAKRTTRYSLRRDWLLQARRQGAATGQPWILVIAEHGDRHPIAVVDLDLLVELARDAGRIS